MALAAGLRATASGAEPLRNEERNLSRAAAIERSSFSMSITFTTDASAENINLSNRNAALVLRALGYYIESGYFSAPAKEFAVRCTQWLHRNINLPSAATATFKQENLIEFGLPEGYLNEKILQLSRLARTPGAKMIYGD